MSSRGFGTGVMYQQSNERLLHGAPVGSFAGSVQTSAELLQQLGEARFLAAFCCAVYNQSDPNLVCSTAAKLLHGYFCYRLAHFTFVGEEVERVSFRGSARSGDGKAPASVPNHRCLTFSGSAGGPGYEITVQFPTGRGNLRIVDAEQACEPSDGFLKSIADCLGSALEKGVEYRRLQELSLRDGLTGLLNRRAFDELLDIEEGRREATMHSMIMVDIDNFKSINDQFGHPAGDQVIARVGGVIRDALRGTDLATRYGGEEFAILLPATSARDAFAVAERIRERVSSLKFSFLRRGVHITASLGVANRPAKDFCSLRDMLSLADESLYQAKRSGKDMTLVHHDNQRLNQFSA